MNTKIYEIMRWLCAIAVVFFIASGLLDNSLSNANAEDVLSAVTETLDMQTMQQADHQMIKRLYGLNPADYESCTLYYPTSNMGAEELLLIKLKDVKQQEQIEAAALARLETQKTSFDGYGIEQYDMLTNNSVLELHGNFVLFVVNPNSAAALAAFENAL